MSFTIFGARGFVGSHLTRALRAAGEEVLCPARGTEKALAASGDGLGHVIYGIGLTGDFRQRPCDTVDAHAGLLSTVLRHASYDSFLYLSSTRVYAGLEGPVDEDTPLTLLPSPDRLYDLSKLTGEALCLAQDTPGVRVVRLSNVSGPGQSRATFLSAVLDELLSTGQVTIHEDPRSEKDYIDIGDVTGLLPLIATTGQHRSYILASGRQTSHAEIGRELMRLTGGRIAFQTAAPLRRFPALCIDRLGKEFGLKPTRLADTLRSLIDTPGDTQ